MEPLLADRGTAGDIIRDDGQVYLRFGTPPTPIPEPFATLIEEQAAAPAEDCWLFPGRHVGQPRSCTGVYNALRDAGLPMRNARTSALRDLVVQAPAPVIALGFHQTTTTRQFTAADGPGGRYAATRSAGSGATPARPRLHGKKTSDEPACTPTKPERTSSARRPSRSSSCDFGSY